MKIKQRRVQFTRTENDLLHSYVRKQYAEGKKIVGLEIYKAFAAEHSAHTAQSWLAKARQTVIQVIRDESAATATSAATNFSSPILQRRKKSAVKVKTALIIQRNG